MFMGNPILWLPIGLPLSHSLAGMAENGYAPLLNNPILPLKLIM
jgi:hypothetical protein